MAGGGEIVYGRRPVAEAQRGRRRVRRGWTADAVSAGELTRPARPPQHHGVLAEAKRAGAWVHGAEAGAATTYVDADLTGKVVLVLGSEGRGLRRLTAAACDRLVSIPVAGRVESLSVAAAASVLLFEAVRQRE